MKEFFERFNEALNIRQKTMADISRETKINRSSLSEYSKGTYKPNQDRIYLIAKALNVSPAWLMGFDVPMEDKKEETLPEQFETPEEAMKFMLNQTVVMGFNGLDITKLSEEEQIQYANDMLEMMKLVSLKYKDKK